MCGEFIGLGIEWVLDLVCVGRGGVHALCSDQHTTKDIFVFYDIHIHYLVYVADISAVVECSQMLVSLYTL